MLNYIHGELWRALRKTGSAVFFFMMLAPIFFFLGSPLQTIKKFFPSTLLTEVLQPVFLGAMPVTSDLILAFLVTAAWIAAGWTVFFLVFRRHGLKIA